MLKGFEDNQIYYDIDTSLILNEDGKEQKYCYEVRFNTPYTTSKNLEPILQVDLKRSFGVEAHLYKEEVLCFIIKDIKNIDSLRSRHQGTSSSLNKTNKEKFIYGHSLNRTLGLLNRLTIPLINESAYGDRKVDIVFPADLNVREPNALIEYLREIGFEIEKERRLIKVIRVTNH
ncbi:hypothetical protein [Niabella ginsengisoli]|uniref:Uncharacterized protein n=1 Tax=Niabella ginsengisoli TaxID=522298 RepID=A0ABS9SHW0_9BACT|nr:hypothetical protein [Niabella ginsengisoli]MCH5597954.1 hypothetical protein [Niabella ginsengisoli]